MIYHIMFHCVEIFVMYNIVSIMLLSVICKLPAYEGLFSSKLKYPYQSWHIIKHVNVIVHILDNNSCDEYICKEW